MNEKNKLIEKQRKTILEARGRGKLALLGAWCKLSGPGWMQSATTLGGGSLASALYLGVLGGFGFMWLQPLAMLFGIVMLAGISYVTLSISDKPMRAINKNVSPVLGYGWAIGSMLACLVFAMPQFSLAVAAIEQNIAPAFFSDGAAADWGKFIITLFFFLLSVMMITFYASGGKGVKIFEFFIKASVAAIVICFFGVIIRLSWEGSINWDAVWSGFVPNFSVFSEPSPDFMSYISKLGKEGAEFWSDTIVSQQIDVVISSAAMAVGINMTFLFPYSMLKKGWDKDFRGLAIFDLATGLFIPFLIATSCIVVASSSQFHAKPAEGLSEASWVVVSSDKIPHDYRPALAFFDGKWNPASSGEKYSELLCVKSNDLEGNLVGSYISLLDSRISASMGAENFSKLSPKERCEAYLKLDLGEREMAAMLVKRDASNLSATLAPLVGEDVARYIFGFGVLGMAMNAILMNMLICGLSFCEIFGKFGSAKWQVGGSFLILFSACASLFWEGAKMWLVIHAGVIAMVLLPIAYGAFMVIMNSSKIMGENKPRGWARVLWNTLMACSLLASSVASLWVLWSKLRVAGVLLFFGFLLAVLVSNMFMERRAKAR